MPGFTPRPSCPQSDLHQNSSQVMVSSKDGALPGILSAEKNLPHPSARRLQSVGHDQRSGRDTNFVFVEVTSKVTCISSVRYNFASLSSEVRPHKLNMASESLNATSTEDDSEFCASHRHAGEKATSFSCSGRVACVGHTLQTYCTTSSVNFTHSLLHA